MSDHPAQTQSPRAVALGMHAPEYVQSLEKRVAKLEKEWREEHRIIAVLVAAGFVTQAKADEARTIVCNLPS